MNENILKKFAPPTTNHLSRIYFELAKLGARALGEKRPWLYGNVKDAEDILALALQMSRYDPRLFLFFYPLL